MPNKAIVIGIVAMIAVVGGAAAYLYLNSGWEEIEIIGDGGLIKAEWNEKKGMYRFTAKAADFEGWTFDNSPAHNSSKKTVTISEEDIMDGEYGNFTAKFNGSINSYFADPDHNIIYPI